MSPHTKNHHYSTTVRWTGNRGAGTGDYRAYERSHEIVVEGKPTIAGSSDPAFRGDAAKHNPEELLVASLSACHMLWYLHLCADAGVVVTDYIDQASGIMSEGDTGVGRFTVVPPKTEYSLTARGKDMLELIITMRNYGLKIIMLKKVFSKLLCWAFSAGMTITAMPCFNQG